LKIRYALVTAGIISALTAAPALAQADNTNSRWSPTVFDAWLQHDQSYNPGDSTYAYSGGSTYVYGGPVYYYTPPSGYYYDPRQRPLVIGRMDPDLVYGPTPNQVHAGTSLSNPSGTELQGQNSGGK
jgi:hypothetical protein